MKAQFKILLKGVRAEGPQGRSADELARVVLPQVLAGVFTDLERSHVLSTTWIVIMEALGGDTPEKPLTLDRVLADVNHTLRSEMTQESTGASAYAVRKGHLAAHRKLFGLAESEVLMLRVATDQDWEKILRASPLADTVKLTEVFDELELVLVETRWPPSFVGAALGIFEECTNRKAKLSLGQIRRQLNWMSKPAREALIDIVCSPDGYTVSRLQGDSDVEALAKLRRSKAITRLILLAATEFPSTLEHSDQRTTNSTSSLQRKQAS